MREYVVPVLRALFAKVRARLLVAACCITCVTFLTFLWRSTELQSSFLISFAKSSGSLSDGSSYIFKGPNATDKVIVMAKMASEDVEWVNEELPDWQHAIYHMDDPQALLHPPINKGREAMAYLTFIIDHYVELPEIMVFLHPHRSGWPEAWHTDAINHDNVRSVQSLRLDYVRANGYANMRCNAAVGCPVEIMPFRNEEGNDREAELAYAAAYMSIFGGNITEVPSQVATACCAQFAVSRDQVLRRPRSDYQHYRQWLIDTELSDAVSGRILEYMWHIMFGKGPVWCPSARACYCEQFGRC